MAFEWGPRHAETYPAGADLTDKQYFVGVRQADGTIVLAGAGLGDGIIEYTVPPKVGASIALVDDGTNKVRLGGTVAIGDQLIAGADGRAIKRVAQTGKVFGVAREAGVAGQIIAARVDFAGAQSY
jgi:hypothetical protein